MFFPFGTDRPLRRPTLVNHLLILLNLFAFCILLGLTGLEGENYERAVEFFGLSRTGGSALGAGSPAGHPVWWQFITYAFMHAGFGHILGNMLFLWVFGPNVEDRLGRVGYLAFYLAGGAASGFAHIWSSPAIVIGASGAISAVTGAFIVLFPRTIVRVIILFISVGAFNIPALWFIGFAIARDIFGAGMGGSNVSYAGHLGGYVFGFAVALFLLSTKILKREDYDLFYMIRQAQRRREINQAIASSRAKIQSGESRTAAKGEGAARAGDSGEVPLEIAQARAELSRAVSASETASLVDRYKVLLETVEKQRLVRPDLSAGLEVLSRRAQLDLANRFFEIGERRLAARAYRGFLSLYDKDREAAAVRVMLGLLMTRYLGEGQQARPILTEAAATLKDRDPEHAALARELLAELDGRIQAVA